MTTYFLILCGFLGLGILGYALLNSWRVGGQILLAIGCLGAASLLGWELYRNVLASSPKAPERHEAVAAYMMAEQVAGAYGDQHGQILVILPSESTISGRVLDALFDSFARVIAAFPNLELKEATLARSGDAAKEGVSLEAFELALASAPQALACVSFAGVPQDFERLSLLKNRKPPTFFVYDRTTRQDWVEPLKKRWIQRVIVPRPHFALPRQKPIAGPPEEIFPHYFLWVTPETADEIVEQLRNR